MFTARRPVDANHNRLRTPVRLDDKWVLKIPLLKGENKYDRSKIWTLFSHYLFPKSIFELNSVIKNREKSFLEVFSKFSQVNLMIPFLPKLTWTLSIAFLNVYVSLEDHSSPLHVQNEASPRSKFSPYFFLLISFKAPQNLKTVDGN